MMGQAEGTKPSPSFSAPKGSLMLMFLADELPRDSRLDTRTSSKQESRFMVAQGSESQGSSCQQITKSKKAVDNYKLSLVTVLYALPLFVAFAVALIVGLGVGLGLRGRGSTSTGLSTNSPSVQGSDSDEVRPVAMPILVLAPSPSVAAPITTPTRAPILERQKILLQSGQALVANETSTLASHHVYLKQHNDGNLVLYRNLTNAGPAFEVWSSGVSLDLGNYFTTIQGDGHMMTLRGTPEVPGSSVWKTNSGRDSAGYRLVLDENGIGLEILQSGNPPVKTWSSIDGVLGYPPPNTSPVILQSGPMVGHTTHRSALIWFLAANRSSTVEVTYKQLASSADDRGVQPRPTTIAMPPRDEHNGSSLAQLENLKASTTYVYQIRIDATPVAQGTFTTAPRPRRPVKFQYLLTSCMNVRTRAGYPEQPVWETIRDKKPDFAMLNGDTIYLNSRDWDGNGVIYSRAWQRNLEQREERYFAEFLSSVPTYMTWDDHDYGADNSYSNQKGKENSLAVLKAVWANPSYGTPNATGVFYSYYWGNVHFIVMDDRWYRKKQWSQFGEEQLEWLYDQLLRSRAPFKVIVSGGTITTYNDHNWIGRFVTENKIYGVLFNAGDTHKNEFLSRSFGSWPYNITQITSSGIARENWMRPWAMLHVDTVSSDPTITVSFYGALNDYTFSEWTHNPNFICTDLEVVEDNVPGWFNSTRCSQTIRLSDLVPEDVPDVVLESPVGGDELLAGSELTILWRTFGSHVETVMLQYTINAGLSWKNITDDWIENTGTYVWNVPPDPSNHVKVRILAEAIIDAGSENYTDCESFTLGENHSNNTNSGTDNTMSENDTLAVNYTNSSANYTDSRSNYTLDVNSNNSSANYTKSSSDCTLGANCANSSSNCTHGVNCANSSANCTNSENFILNESHTFAENYSNSEKYTVNENYGLMSIKMQHEIVTEVEGWV